MNNVQPYEYTIGKDGNSITVSKIKNDWYMLVVSDHYDDNHIGLFLHKEDIAGLAQFLNNFLENISCKPMNNIT